MPIFQKKNVCTSLGNLKIDVGEIIGFQGIQKDQLDIRINKFLQIFAIQKLVFLFLLQISPSTVIYIVFKPSNTH